MGTAAQTLIERLLVESPHSISASSFGMDDPAKEALFVPNSGTTPAHE